MNDQFCIPLHPKNHNVSLHQIRDSFVHISIIIHFLIERIDGTTLRIGVRRSHITIQQPIQESRACVTNLFSKGKSCFTCVNEVNTSIDTRLGKFLDPAFQQRQPMMFGATLAPSPFGAWSYSWFFPRLYNARRRRNRQPCHHQSTTRKQAPPF